MQWIKELQQKVEQLGRRKVESDTGYSRTTLSQLLNNKYPGNMPAMEQLFKNAYSQQIVVCPVLSEITVARCNNEQNKPFSASNPTRLRF